jgi:hypothetical protein
MGLYPLLVSIRFMRGYIHSISVDVLVFLCYGKDEIMIKLFGATCTSPTIVQHASVTRLGVDKVVSIGPNASTFSLKGTVLALIHGVNLLKVHRERLNKYRGVGLVFDGPLSLHEYSKIEFLDLSKTTRVNTVDYKFQMTPFDYYTLFQAVDGVSNDRKKFPLKRESEKLLDHVVARKATGGLMEHVNDVIYFTPDRSVRVNIQYSIIQTLLYKITVAKMKKDVCSLLDNDDSRRRVVDKLANFISGEEGQRFCRVLRILLDQKKLNLRDAKKRSSIENMLDLRGLVDMYRSVYRVICG